jgi:hypothetical protein
MILKETEGNYLFIFCFLICLKLNCFLYFYRKRNKKEIEEGQLPMTPIVMTDKSGKRIVPQGNPKYMVSKGTLSAFL